MYVFNTRLSIFGATPDLFCRLKAQQY